MMPPLNEVKIEDEDEDEMRRMVMKTMPRTAIHKRTSGSRDQMGMRKEGER